MRSFTKIGPELVKALRSLSVLFLGTFLAYATADLGARVLDYSVKKRAGPTLYVYVG